MGFGEVSNPVNSEWGFEIKQPQKVDVVKKISLLPRPV